MSSDGHSRDEQFAVFVLLLSFVSVGHAYSVMHHLSTNNPYEYSLKNQVNDNDPSDTIISSSCRPIHLNLLARHGTRHPTRKRIRQMIQFSEKIRSEGRRLAPDGSHGRDELSWMANFKSPWDGQVDADPGQLSEAGEMELFEFGQRIRRLFPTLFSLKYRPSRYAIIATNVARASASAVSFGLGLFHGHGRLGAANQKPFSVTVMSDHHLRFHDSCHAYVDSKSEGESLAAPAESQVAAQVAASLALRHGLNFSSADVAHLWLTCKQLAAVFGDATSACALLSEDDVLALEWSDDVALHWVKGYGRHLNYKMGAPLLSDVLKSMAAAAKGGEERARLRFAHAETLVPFLCLLGLFKEGDQGPEGTQGPQPMVPAQNRRWVGSQVAPYGGNVAIVLLECDGVSEEERFKVDVLHNEKRVLVEGCPNGSLCSLGKFEQLMGIHLKESFEEMCAIPPYKVERKENAGFFSIANQLVSRLCRYIFSMFKDIKGELNKEL